jgi:hypothetical protein
MTGTCTGNIAGMMFMEGRGFRLFMAPHGRDTGSVDCVQTRSGTASLSVTLPRDAARVTGGQSE